MVLTSAEKSSGGAANKDKPTRVSRRSSAASGLSGPLMVEGGGAGGVGGEVGGEFWMEMNPAEWDGVVVAAAGVSRKICEMRSVAGSICVTSVQGSIAPLERAAAKIRPSDNVRQSTDTQSFVEADVEQHVDAGAQIRRRPGSDTGNDGSNMGNDGSNMGNGHSNMGNDGSKHLHVLRQPLQPTLPRHHKTRQEERQKKQTGQAVSRMKKGTMLGQEAKEAGR